MIWFIAAFFALYFFHAGYRRDGIHENCLSPAATLPVKGPFVLLIFASHLSQYYKAVAPADLAYRSFKAFIGQMVVVPFMLYSGYGVMEQFKRKGWAYIESFPRRRILKTVFLFDTAVAIFWIVRHLLGFRYDAMHMLLTFLGWRSIGNSNWYIFMVVILYALAWANIKLFVKPDGSGKIAAATMLALSCVILTDFLAPYRPSYVYNTIFAFCAGCYLSLFAPKLFAVARNNRAFAGLAIIAALGYVSCQKHWNAIFAYDLSSVLFALFTVLVTMKVQSKSIVLNFCGRHVFSIYILQRIPMMLFARTWLVKYPYAYFLVSLAATIPICLAFDSAVSWLWNRFESLMEKKGS